MCGIAGIWQKEAGVEPDTSRLWQLVNGLEHRGPDACQVSVDTGVGLGHTRLAILDLDPRSNQPMLDADTGCMLVFNGEIYNYIELRDELRARGHRFVTEGDSEVLMKAYAEWGTDCLAHFNGMWAFALHDPRNKTLFCARDRLGIKPFVYGVTQQGDVVFASEPKSILAAYPEFRRPNLDLLTHYLQYATAAAYAETHCEGLYNLQPGHVMVLTHGQPPRPQRYWVPDTAHISPIRPVSDSDALAHFKDLLTDAIRLRFRSDVPVGSCLSGGLDSGAIVGLASKLFETPISTFSCVYPQFPEVDEARYIRATAQKFKTYAHETTPTFTGPDDVIAALETCVYEQDGPTGHPTVLSQRAVMASAQAGGVRVLLDGQGGDEVLGGYHTYFPQAVMAAGQAAARNPLYLPAYLQERQAIARRTGQPAAPLWPEWKQARKLKPGFKLGRLFRGHLLEGLEPFDDPLRNTMLRGLLSSFVDLLQYEDRNAMRFAIESRLPFCDYRLVEYSFGLSHQYKIRAARTKWLLWQTIQNLLPAEVVNRPDKMGFATPGSHWYRHGNTPEYFKKYLETPPEPMRDILRRLPADYISMRQAELSRCVAGQPLTQHEEGNLWRYITACAWLRQLDGDTPASEPVAASTPAPTYASQPEGTLAAQPQLPVPKSQRPLKIAMLLDNEFVWDRRVEREAAVLTEAGHQVTLMAVHKEGMAVEETHVSGFHIHRLLKRRLPYYFVPQKWHRWLRPAWKLLRRYGRFDVVHAHDCPMLPTGYALAKLCGAKLVYDSHEWWPGLLESRRQEVADGVKVIDDEPRRQRMLKGLPLLMQLERWILPRCTAIISVNQSICDKLATRSQGQTRRPAPPTVALRNIPEGAVIDPLAANRPRRFHQHFSFAPGDKVVLFQGGIEPNRRIHQIVEAWKTLTDDRIKLVLMGPAADPKSYFETLWAAVQSNPVLRQRVFYKEPVYGDELAQWTASADLGLVTIHHYNESYYLALPNKLFEYLQAGLPVVGSNFPELERLIYGYDVGWCAPPDEPEAIVAQVAAYFADEGRQQHYARQVAKAQAELNWPVERQKLLSLYSSLA